MEGDILILNEDHLKAGDQAVKLIINEIKATNRKYLITVAGESGAGKSEVAEAISRSLKKNGITSYIFAQDDYFVLPPKSNSEKRKKNIKWVGTGEVRLDLLNEEITQIKSGHYTFDKPLVKFNENTIESERINLEPFKVIIFEGTYTTLLKNTDTRIFIDRDYHDTRSARLKRNREKQDDFLEQILNIEHDIISKHKKKADLLVTENYDVIKNNI